MSYPNPCPGCGIGMTEEEFDVHDCPRVDPYDEPPPKPKEEKEEELTKEMRKVFGDPNKEQA